MNTRCDRIELQERLLEALRRGRAPEEPKAAAHLASCEACRAAARRLRRVRETWKLGAPSEQEIAFARTRLMARRERAIAPVWWSPLGWMSAGAAAALVVVAAARGLGPVEERASVILPERAPPGSAGAAPASAAPSAPPPPALPSGAGTAEGGYVERAGKRTPLAQGTRIDLAPEERAEIVPARGEPIALAGPCLVELRVDGAAPSGWRVVYLEGKASEPGPELPPSASPEVAPPTSARPSGRRTATAPAPDASIDRAWAQAADAMKKGDFGAADAALSTLNASQDRATRESSRLARAELLIAHGRTADARLLLESLAKDGSTEFVRKRAAALLSGGASKP